MYKKGIISVILPIYNMEVYLSRCLDSIINNTYEQLEIICVNDGSCDKSAEIVQFYQKNDSRIKLIDKTNGGVSSARNEGLSVAIGEYVAFIDPDDWIDERYFEILLNAIVNSNADIAICEHKKCREYEALHTTKNITVSDIDMKKYLSTYNFKSYVWGRLYKHCLIEKDRFDEDVEMEDIFFNITNCLKHTESHIVYVNAPLYAYYFREGSAVSNINENSILQLAEKISEINVDICDNLIKKQISKEVIKRALAARYLFMLLRNQKKIEICNELIQANLKSTNALIKSMYYCPYIYRAFRIVRDPSLLKFEKSITHKELFINK